MRILFLLAILAVFAFGYGAEKRLTRYERGYYTDRELRRQVRAASRWTGVRLRAAYAEIGYFPPRRWRR